MRVCLIIGDMPNSEEIFCQTRQIFAGIHIVHDPIEGSCTMILHGRSMRPCRIYNDVWQKKARCLGVLTIFKQALERKRIKKDFRGDEIAAGGLSSDCRQLAGISFREVRGDRLWTIN